MSRFNTVTFNTGNVAAAGGTSTFHPVIGPNQFNLSKLKIVPSGSSIGYLVEIFKKSTCLAVDRQYSTRDRLQGTGVDPTDRLGNEELEGWVLPYEDLDATGKMHLRITNYDPVIRTYDITYATEDYIAAALATLNPASPIAFVGVNGTLPTPATSAGNIRLYRNGLRLRQGAGLGYTVAMNLKDLILTIAASGDDYFEAEHY